MSETNRADGAAKRITGVVHAPAVDESPRPADSTERVVLHVGCGAYKREKLHRLFHGPEWREVRLDIDPAVEPDIVASITDMHVVADESVDAVWSSHNLEHLYAHEVPIALGEFRRVLKTGGLVLITLPDLQKVAELVCAGKLVETAYHSPAGPITPLDMIYGHRASIRRGNVFMAHRTGFTAVTLAEQLRRCGLVRVVVKRSGFDLWAVGYRLITA
jgi:SAM-dependent methyltransferase